MSKSSSSLSSSSGRFRRTTFCQLRNFTILFACLTVFLVLYLSFAQSEVASQSVPPEAMKDLLKKLDLSKEELPAGLNLDKVQVRVDKIDVDGVPVTYRSADPQPDVPATGQIVFLLHGAAFTSKTWVDQVPTVQTMASVGHRVFAVDLPGFGDTPGYNGDRAEFLETLIGKLCGDVRPVLVSPSMSGSFSLPLLQRNQDTVSGFIPVAPVGTGTFSSDFYNSVHVPTMIVYGENDYGLGRESKKNLEQIPTTTQPQELAKARHPAYLDQPAKWHQIIYNFMKALAQ